MSRCLPNLAAACLAITAILIPQVVAHAQVTAEVILDRQTFIADEAVVAGVKVVNFSGRTLKLGADPKWIRFNLASDTKQVVDKDGDVPMDRAFDLESSNQAIRRANITPYFRFSQPGHYRLSATVTIPGVGEITAKPASFDLMSGSRLWEQACGFTPKSGPEETRRFILIRASHNNQMRLYVRVTDAEERRVFQVYPIGTLLTFSAPEKQIDRHSNLHVLSQFTARAFNYCVIDPNGNLILRQTWDYTANRPILVLDDSGEIMVKGGARHPTASDLPGEGPDAAVKTTQNEVPPTP